MKTCSLYGFISALAGAFVTLILYFLGFHSDASKLQVAGWIGGLVGIAVTVTCLYLGVRARRDETPKEADFGYGKAAGAGTLISLVASFLSAVFAYTYYAFINPAFTDLMVQAQMAKMEARGMSGDQLEKAEAMTKWMMSAGPASVMAFFYIFILGVILALIVAAFVKRPVPNTPAAL
jgi:Protein of unknown function (DUF4199)